MSPRSRPLFARCVVMGVVHSWLPDKAYAACVRQGSWGSTGSTAWWSRATMAGCQLGRRGGGFFRASGRRGYGEAVGRAADERTGDEAGDSDRQGGFEQATSAGRAWSTSCGLTAMISVNLECRRSGWASRVRCRFLAVVPWRCAPGIFGGGSWLQSLLCTSPRRSLSILICGQLGLAGARKHTLLTAGPPPQPGWASHGGSAQHTIAAPTTNTGSEDAGGLSPGLNAH